MAKPKITSTEFGVCIRNKNNDESLGMIPIDKSVQIALREMLTSTRKQLGNSEDGFQLERFEPAQKYSPKETLWLPLNDEHIKKIKNFYELKNIDTNPGLLNDVKQLYYYFAIFHLNNGNKVIGVRRTTQFKGVVSAKNRLIQLVDDSLRIATDDIFKLDKSFDFLIQKTKILIVSPSSLAQIADLNEYIMKSASSSIRTMSKSIPFISFNSIINYVGKHIRSAKLIASLKNRNDLHLISKNQFIFYCEENDIPYETNGDGVILPVKGHELGFLQLLDRRRFTTELIEGTLERYEAPNRRNVN